MYLFSLHLYCPRREILLWLWSSLVYFVLFSKTRKKNKRKIEKPVRYLRILLHSILERKDARTEDGAFFLANSSPQQKPSALLQASGSPAETSERPAPRVVSEEELNLVRTCLQRWRNEIEQDVQGWPQIYLLWFFCWMPAWFPLCSSSWIHPELQIILRMFQPWR